VEEQIARIDEVCRMSGARDARVAHSEEERALLWKGRKNAFGAIGRVSPTYYVQDGVVPRTRVADTLEAIGRIGEKYGIAVSNVFHAGDGNMHPILPFDPRKPGDLERAQKAGDEILEYCISVGGSITGEHGVGMEKMDMMAHLFPEETLDLIKRFKTLFDPECRLNPGKVLPTGKGCLEIRQRPEMVL
jgi:glycolate oxidase